MTHSLTVNQLSNHSVNVPVTNTSIKLSVETNHKDKEPKNQNMSLSMAVILLSIFAGALMLSKGFQKTILKYIDNIKESVENKFEKATLYKSNKKADFYKLSLKSINSFIKKTESINNITSLKDILFMKLMFKTEPTKKIHEYITDYSEKISRNSVIDSYKKTEKNFKEMNDIIDRLDEYILNKSPNEIVEHKGKKYTHKEFVEKAKFHRERANLLINEFISQQSLDKRYKYINEANANLYSTFWDESFKDFWSGNNKFKRKEMWQTFIAAEQVQGNKTHLASEIAQVRKSLVYAKKDKIKLINKYIEELNDIIPQQDKEGTEIVEKIKWYTKYSDGFQYNKSAFIKELDKLEKHQVPWAINKNLSKTRAEYKDVYIKTIKELMDDSQRGDLREMMALYYKIVPYELTKSGAADSVKRAVKSFDNSVNLETVDFFDRIRDLRLGCAPTDVLTILISFLTLLWGLGYAKDRQEKYSVMNRVGIPLLGAAATTMYTSARLVSGGKSLALGFLSGIVLNQLGKITDKIFNPKDTTNKQNNLNQNKENL